MKKFLRLAVVLLVLSASVLAVTACGDTPVSILIEEANMPRTVFVQGQDIDLSDGMLTVKYGKKTELIPLNSSGVAVSGYDKNKLDTQEIKITYKKKSAPLTVTVVPRMRFQGITTTYFVGEQISRQGEFRLTYNDGTFKNVSFSDSEVTVLDFNSSAPAMGQSVTVQYEGFTDTFNINMYAADKITFTPTGNNKYQSHATSIHAGSYFTLTASGGAAVKTVALTTAMTQGFNPAEATIANRTTDLTQSVTAQYLGKSFSFDIKIHFSDVSLIKLRAQELEGIANWMSLSKVPTIEKEAGDNAIEAMTLYFGLSEDDKTFISNQEIVSLVRPAAVYGYVEWDAAIVNYEKTFYLDGDTLSVLTNLEDTIVTRDMLADPNHIVNVAGDLLERFLQNYQDIEIIKNLSVGQFLAETYNVDAKSRTYFVGIINFMIELYNLLEPIGADWTPEELGDHLITIRLAYETMTYTKYADYAANRAIFGAINSWRKDATGADDFFDIIYRFYYDRNGQNEISKMAKVYLPKTLEEIHKNIVDAIALNINILTYAEYDATLYMWCCRNVERLVATVLAGDNAMYKDIYYGVKIDFGFDDGYTYTLNERWCVAQASELGYIELKGALLFDDEFNGYWDTYLSVIDKLMTDPQNYTEGNQDFNSDVENLFETFALMSPIRQFGFLSSLSPNYLYYLDNDTTAKINYVFSADATYTIFASIILNHYKTVLSSSGNTAFSRLADAVERYALYGRSFLTGYITISPFTSAIGTAETTVNIMNSTARREFRETGDLGAVYDKYIEIYNRYRNGNSTSNPKKTDLGTWQPIFEQLNTALLMAYECGIKMFPEDDKVDPVYMSSAIISLFHLAKGLESKIEQEAPQEIKEAYYYEAYPIISGELSAPLSQLLYFVGYHYAYTFRVLGDYVNGYFGILTDFCKSGDAMDLFFKEAGKVIFKYLNKGTFTLTDADIVTSAVTAFINMSATQKAVFYTMIEKVYLIDEANERGIYQSALIAFVDSALSFTIRDAAKKLIAYEAAFASFYRQPSASSGVTGQAVIKAKNDFEAAYNLLSNANKTLLDGYFAGMREFYLAEYNKLGW